MNVLKIKELSVRYGSVEALSEVDLEVQPAMVYGIIGPDGAGKTTLLNIISTLLPGYEGSVKIDGMEAKERKMEYLQKIFVLPEIITEDNNYLTIA